MRLHVTHIVCKFSGTGFPPRSAGTLWSHCAFVSFWPGDTYAAEGVTFTGYFAPCYGRAETTKLPGQDYVSLASRQFWKEVGNGDADFDIKVGEVCAMLCAHGRKTLIDTLVPNLVANLTAAASPIIGDKDGKLNYNRLFRRINK